MKVNTIIFFVILLTLVSCNKQKSPSMATTNITESTHKAWVSLTVAESKRLIAVGLSEYAPMKERMKKGTIIITKGTTNSYVAQELLGDKFDQQSYVYGYIAPATGGKKIDRSGARREVVLVDGVDTEAKYTFAIREMLAGDIVLKGANIINYSKGQAGVLIEHPTGGTSGNIMPSIEANNLRLIIPVGLEKESSQDIDLLSEVSKLEKKKIDHKVPYIWSLKGELFTEIEAIKQFAEVEVLHLASGGVGGAEGAVSLVILGREKEIQKALAVIKSIQGEKEFIE